SSQFWKLILVINEAAAFCLRRTSFAAVECFCENSSDLSLRGKNRLHFRERGKEPKSFTRPQNKKRNETKDGLRRPQKRGPHCPRPRPQLKLVTRQCQGVQMLD